MIPPGRPGSKSTIEVIHGSERRHGPVPSSPSRVQRTLRARVSSIPIIAVGTAGPAAAAAASTRIRWAVAHAIPHSAATSLTARFAPATAAPTRSRSLVVTRERAGSCALACVNDLRGHSASKHTKRRLRTRKRNATAPCGTSLTRLSGRSLTREDTTPHAGQPPSESTTSASTSRPPSTPSATSRTR